ncbi:MAG: Bifunctional homocysteine S-methyltransferase/5,10-methylenetetrahydrofolate reductase [Chloroflexi bacterium ADurb.Bin360]|nr:MAG: Bifunctional homocysteine S-methyltransferase/5,10-methylenetetrahydrofolate reductase [Chloroflexi bacterium ADurb.Bin360]
MQVVLIGLGRMGANMARRWARGGVNVVAFDQSEEARAAFIEQITALAAADVDVISLETFTDLYEIREAVAAARQVCDLPVIASMTFTRDDRTLLGDGPEKVARALVEMGADVIGVNCSGGPAQLQRILQRMKLAAPEVRLSAGPNAGWPEQVAGRIMYPATADYFAEYALAFRQIGAALIGGCCGTTPEHIAAMRRALDAPPGPEVELAVMRHLEPEPAENGATPPTRLAEKFAAGKFVVAVEMDPPHTISSHKLLAGASLLADVGVDVINVADSPMARMRMSPWAVCHLIQKEVGMETVLHFPTRGRNLLRVQGDLLAAHTLGIRNVFVVMGDPTAIGDYPEAMDNYDLAPSGLIQLIKEKLNAGRDHAGSDIGRPTAFFVGGALNLDPPEPEREIKVLRRKLRSGVDFLITQPVYQPERAQAFLERYTAEYGPLPAPVLAGILPLNNLRHARFLHNEVPGITICPEIFERLERADKESAREGVRIAAELIEQVRPWASGVYIMPAFSRYDLAAEVAEAALRL